MIWSSTSTRVYFFAVLYVCFSSAACIADDPTRLVLKGSVATAAFTLQGGGLVEFRLNESSVNPVNWEVAQNSPPNKAEQPRPQGHFLCLDRWGAPSKSELAKGIPFHGEAPHVSWQIKQLPTTNSNQMSAVMTCALPLAGIEVERNIVLETNSTAIVVIENVKNISRLGRLYNMVQHPTIAPPFLDDSTVVNSNAEFGFSQQGHIPDSKQEAHRWPQMRLGDEVADLSHFSAASLTGTSTEANSDVSSFVFADDVKFGWVTAMHSKSRLLLGYYWRTADYPWLNIWRFRKGNSVLARGLEFGTTGYHQPFPILLKQHKILGRGLYEYLDADETHARSYVAFVAPIPEDLHGVESISHSDGNIHVHYDGKREVRIPLSKLPWDN